MPYKPTGKPPGRPRKEVALVVINPAKPLSRAHAGFKRLAVDVTSDLHRPPRRRKTETGRRPVLHPNVIANG